MATRRQFPIGEQDFANICNRKMFYIDKTHLIYDMASHCWKYLFFRPRCFGKSLFLSTMRYYFEGCHDLFEGLAIDTMEKDWRKRPVIYLDLSYGHTFNLNKESIIHKSLINVVK